VALALPIIGLTAAFLPARRAASIQPMQALREE
jgi:ABC-type lipoprotein release transport system permease subunit